MADLVFLLHGDFCHRLAILRQVEQRIISKAAVSFVEITDDALAGTFCCDFLSIRPYKCNDSYIMALAVISGIRFQVFHKFSVVGLIIAMLSCITGGINTRAVA